MRFFGGVLSALALCCTSVLATLPSSYDVVWNKPGVNGSADSMPLGGGDIGLNTWYENSKLAFDGPICIPLLTLHPRHHSHVRRKERYFRREQRSS